MTKMTVWVCDEVLEPCGDAKRSGASESYVATTSQLQFLGVVRIEEDWCFCTRSEPDQRGRFLICGEVLVGLANR